MRQAGPSRHRPAWSGPRTVLHRFLFVLVFHARLLGVMLRFMVLPGVRTDRLNRRNRLRGTIPSHGCAPKAWHHRARSRGGRCRGLRRRALGLCGFCPWLGGRPGFGSVNLALADTPPGRPPGAGLASGLFLCHSMTSPFPRRAQCHPAMAFGRSFDGPDGFPCAGRGVSVGPANSPPSRNRRPRARRNCRTHRP